MDVHTRSVLPRRPAQKAAQAGGVHINWMRFDLEKKVAAAIATDLSMRVDAQDSMKDLQDIVHDLK